MKRPRKRPTLTPRRESMYPALDAWLARREPPERPSAWTYDTLWRVACWEASAREAQANKRYESARRDMARAREILLEAAA